MVISFDLDDTLIPGMKKFETERQTIIPRLFGIERIRLGTIELFKELRSREHRIYIYTTSFRSIVKIRLMFYLYGIAVDNAINQQKHNFQLRENKARTSKFPPAFGIDIHVDDSPGLSIEGDRYSFKTIIIDQADANWVKKILERLEKVDACSFSLLTYSCHNSILTLQEKE